MEEPEQHEGGDGRRDEVAKAGHGGDRGTHEHDLAPAGPVRDAPADEAREEGGQGEHADHTAEISLSPHGGQVGRQLGQQHAEAGHEQHRSPTEQEEGAVIDTLWTGLDSSEFPRGKRGRIRGGRHRRRGNGASMQGCKGTHCPP